MTIRRPYRSKGLDTKIVKTKIIDGEYFDCSSSVGYFMGGKAVECTYKLEYGGKSEGIPRDIDIVRYFPAMGFGLGVSTDGVVYVWTESENSFTRVSNIEYPTPSFFSGYEGEKRFAAVVGGRKIVRVLEDKSAVAYVIHYSLKGACLCMGRLFAADAQDEYVLRWSGPNGFDDWTQSAFGAGYMRFNPARGRILSTVPFGDRVAVFREYGLDFLKVNGDPRHFSVTYEYGEGVSEKLGDGTCVCCRGKLYFCSDEHMYVCDGSGITRMQFPDYMQPKLCTHGAAIEDRYVVYYCKHPNSSTRYQFIYDVDEKKYGFFAYGASTVWKTANGFYSWRSGRVHVPLRDYSDANGDMASSLYKGNLGSEYSGMKLLKSVTLDASGDARLSVRSLYVTRYFTGNGKIPINMPGNTFSLSLSGNCKVRSLEVEWEVRK